MVSCWVYILGIIYIWQKSTRYSNGLKTTGMHMITLRKRTKQQKKYSWKSSLSSWAVVQVGNSVQSMLLTQKYQQQRYLVCFHNKIVIVFVIETNKGQVIRKWIHHLSCGCVDASVVNFELIIALADHSQIVIHLGTGKVVKEVQISKEDTPSKWRNRQLITFEGKDESRVWQTVNGMLMKGSKVVSKQFGQMGWENSMDEFEHYEKNISFPVKYHLSDCREYLIGNILIKEEEKMTRMSKIRSKSFNWALVFEFQNQSEINPYYSHYIQYQKELNQPYKPLERFLMAEYVRQSNLLRISLITIDEGSRKKMVFDERLKSDAWEEVKYSSSRRVVAELANVKDEVLEIRWIGLAELVLLMEQGKLFVVEFDKQVLKLDQKDDI